MPTFPDSLADDDLMQRTSCLGPHRRLLSPALSPHIRGSPAGALVLESRVVCLQWDQQTKDPTHSVICDELELSETKCLLLNHIINSYISFGFYP